MEPGVASGPGPNWPGIQRAPGAPCQQDHGKEQQTDEDELVETLEPPAEIETSRERGRAAVPLAFEDGLVHVAENTVRRSDLQACRR